MLRDTALTICPEYPPENLERLPHYEGYISTQEENKAVFRNLWKQGEALLEGSMALSRRDMRLTTDTANNTVIGTLVQPKSYPVCGFTMKMSEETQSKPRSLYIEVNKSIEKDEKKLYVKRRMHLYSDGSANSETLQQGIIGRRTLSEVDHLYERHQHLTTDDLRSLDDLYVYINFQHQKQSGKAAEKQRQRHSLTRYIGRRAMRAWHYLTG